MDCAVGFGSEAAHLGEFGVRLNGQPPSLVLGQVPMQHVHFLKRQDVDHVLDKGRRHEMPATVEQQPSVREVRAVLNRHRRKLKPLGTALFAHRGHQLPQRRPRAKRPFRVLRFGHDAVVFHRQRVAFGTEGLVGVGPQHVRLVRVRSRPHQAGVGQPRFHRLHAPWLWPGHLQHPVSPKATPLAVFATKFQRGGQGHKPRG